MRLYFYSHTLHPGGAEKQCALIATELKRRFGHESIILLNDGSDIKEEYLNYVQNSGVAVEVLPKGRIKRFRRLWRLFSEDRGAALFNYLTYPDFIGGMLAKLSGLKLIVGGIETDRMFGLKFWAEYVSHKFFSHVTICNSHKAFDFFAARGFDSGRMLVIPSGIETKGLVSARFGDDAPVEIISVGRFVPEKDYSTWVKVIARLYAIRPRIHATIIGYGSLEKSIRAEIDEANIGDVVSVLPGQATDIFAVLAKSQIYLSTSVQEGTSNTILEGMAHGLPVVATDVGDNGYMIEDGVNGYLREPRDVEGLTKALVSLVDSCQNRHLMGMRSKAKVVAEYSLEVILKKYCDIISGIS